MPIASATLDVLWLAHRMRAAAALAPQTTAEESLFHDGESSCLGCSIARQYDPALTMCPAVDCLDTSAAEAGHAVLAASCTAGGRRH